MADYDAIVIGAGMGGPTTGALPSVIGSCVIAAKLIEQNEAGYDPGASSLGGSDVHP
jgi:hypothetical protein